MRREGDRSSPRNKVRVYIRIHTSARVLPHCQSQQQRTADSGRAITGIPARHASRCSSTPSLGFWASDVRCNRKKLALRRESGERGMGSGAWGVAGRREQLREWESARVTGRAWGPCGREAGERSKRQAVFFTTGFVASCEYRRARAGNSTAQRRARSIDSTAGVGSSLYERGEAESYQGEVVAIAGTEAGMLPRRSGQDGHRCRASECDSELVRTCSGADSSSSSQTRIASEMRWRTECDRYKRKWQRQWIPNHVTSYPRVRVRRQEYAFITASWEREACAKLCEACGGPSAPAPTAACLSCVIGRVHDPRDARHPAPHLYAQARRASRPGGATVHKLNAITRKHDPTHRAQTRQRRGPGKPGELHCSGDTTLTHAGIARPRVRVLESGVVSTDRNGGKWHPRRTA